MAATVAALPVSDAGLTSQCWKEIDRWRDRLKQAELNVEEALHRAADAEADLSDRLGRCEALEKAHDAMEGRCQARATFGFRPKLHFFLSDS